MSYDKGAAWRLIINIKGYGMVNWFKDNTLAYLHTTGAHANEFDKWG